MKQALVRIYRVLISFRNNTLPRYFVASPFMSSLYYILFSSKFRREQHAVLKGRIEHIRQVRREGKNLYLLIRNTHRIEKGLLMRPRRNVFALDYIQETVETFVNVWQPSKMESDFQHKWFYDVLSEYFSTSGDHPLVNELSDIFSDRVKHLSVTGEKRKSIPYNRLIKHMPQITYEDFYSLTRYRRSVRWFLDKKVPHDLVDKAILAANQSPSACNRQPFEYRIVDEPALLKKVAGLPGGVRGYEEGIQMMVVCIGNLDAYFDERDRHVIYIDASLANMSFMFALETLGLSSCAINWPDVEHLERGMEQALGLKKHQRPIMCMAVGYPDPDGKVAYSEKRSIEYLRKYN